MASIDHILAPLRWEEAGLHVDDQEGLARGISEGGRCDDCICGHGRFVRVWLASSRASLAPTEDAGWPAIYQTPDATKPALGGLCRFRIGGAGGI